MASSSKVIGYIGGRSTTGQEGANSEGQTQPKIHTYRCLDVGEPFLVERSEGKSILQLRGVCLTTGREGKGNAEVRLSIVGEI